MTGRPQAARSRNGCITCKIRRVKCDEQRPECNRCLSTGRTCDGYQDGSQSQSLVQKPCSLRIIQHIPPGRKIQPAVQVNVDEHRNLEFFHHYTLPGLGPEVSSYLLQATTSEPVIRTVAMAVGSVHRSFAFVSDEDTTFTLLHYNKAIRQLVTSPQSKSTVLLACILFFCCECLQGRYKTAIQHALSGLRILQQQQLLPPSSLERAPAAVSSLFHAVQSQVLEIEGMEGLDPESQPKLSPPASNANPLQAGLPLDVRDHQRIFRQLYYRFVQIDALIEAFESIPNDNSPAHIAHEQQLLAEWFRVRADLKTWMRDFDCQTIHAWQADPRTASLHADSIAILKAWKLLFSMYFRMDWPPSELAWDQFTPDFQSIVSLVSIVTGNNCINHVSAALNVASAPTTTRQDSRTPPRRSAPPPLLPTPPPPVPSQPIFTLSLGFLTPLYICATRCRDSTIRHHALRLLETCRRREGVWDSDLAARVARRIIAIEEQAAGVEPGIAVYRSANISLEARVRSSSPQFAEGRKATLRYVGGGSGPEVGLMEETIVW
ncbi:hypothetical protein BO99DRAFT_237573 [Aspergillus violaceofuscus CBS 115571]|uniref:Zn(2)-C6 fungal-type domain-containing protein n=1 Tax=Aspergillus violaceofuscus (strain CBS 115571) TaxID=1450538 RepID=A0A2V5HI55_ASPV1|nr:hypothetical protein BO99DRAFT_237573 [Aspergillus violaceofuscus CBS 115571]